MNRLKLPGGDFPFKDRLESCLMWLVLLVVGPVIMVKALGMLWSLVGADWPYAVAVLVAIGLFGVWKLIQRWRCRQ